MNLEELGKTVNPARGITASVLVQYELIHAARQMLWDWQTIAGAMEMPGKASQIRQAFTRIKEGLTSGDIALPKGQPKIDTSGKRPAQSSGKPMVTPKKSMPGQPVDWEALSQQRRQEEEGIEWTG